MNPRALMTGDPRYCGFNQALEKGWHVRKGEHGTQIMYVPRRLVEDKDNPDESRLVYSKPVFHTVFHASQIEGIPDYVPPTIEEAPWTRPEAAQIILKNSGAVVRSGGDRRKA